MSTLVDDRTDVDSKLNVSDNGDHDRMAHYYRKKDIDKAFFEGVKIQALCGKWDLPVRDPQKYPRCKTCEEVFKNIPEG